MRIEKKLTGHPAAQCKVVLNDENIALISYKTTVITVEKYDNGYIISCSGLYSMTTRKHINWFLREYFPKIAFYDIKAIAGLEKYIYIDKYNNVSTINGDK